jgi:hypothetical protein
VDCCGFESYNSSYVPVACSHGLIKSNCVDCKREISRERWLKIKNSPEYVERMRLRKVEREEKARLKGLELDASKKQRAAFYRESRRKARFEAHARACEQWPWIGPGCFHAQNVWTVGLAGEGSVLLCAKCFPSAGFTVGLLLWLCTGKIFEAH